MTMTGINFACCLLVVFQAGELSAILDDYCTDLSYYGVVQYTTSTKQCCKPKLKHSCEYKAEQVCKDVMEVQCEPQSRVECRSETSFASGKKCEVESKNYDYKDCNKKVTTRVDCQRNSVNTCKPKLNAAFVGELTCTNLFYEDCIVVDDAVGGCSRDELDKFCSCPRDYDPVCAGGLLYDNLCLYECAKKKAECAAVKGFPAVGDIDECVAPDSKGAVNRDAIKEFKDLLLAIEVALAKLGSSRSRSLSSSITDFTDAEYKLLLAIVKAREYVEEQCSIENGQCDLAKLEALIDESNSKYYAVQNTGKVSSGYLKTFAEEREKFEVIAEVAEETQTKLAVKPTTKDCTCSDFTNDNGVGKCQKRLKIGKSIAFGGHVACYVNLPTSCSDVIQSETNPGLFLSADACNCANVDPKNAVALESCGLVPLGRAGSNRLDGIRPLGRAAQTSVPTCTTPFQVKWADYIEVDKATLMQDTVCEVKSSVECKRVSVKKCTQVDWKECSLRPVQECEAVLVSQPMQEKVHQKKCLTGDDDSKSSSSSRSRSPPSRGSLRSGSSQSQSSSRDRASPYPYNSGAQASRAAQDYSSKFRAQESDYYGQG